MSTYLETATRIARDTAAKLHRPTSYPLNTIDAVRAAHPGSEPPLNTDAQRQWVSNVWDAIADGERQAAALIAADCRELIAEIREHNAKFMNYEGAEAIARQNKYESYGSTAVERATTAKLVKSATYRSAFRPNRGIGYFETLNERELDICLAAWLLHVAALVETALDERGDDITTAEASALWRKLRKTAPGVGAKKFGQFDAF